MYKRKLFVIGGLLILVFGLNNCMTKNDTITDFRGESYAGASKCISCHKEIVDSYLRTAHSMTSNPATKNFIKGCFSKDSNVVYYRPTLKVEMEETDSGFYQGAYIDNIKRQQERFDIVVGSGTKGQTYLYWANNHVFQLPVSFYVPEKQWVNSPGFPPKYVLYNRNISIGCFECHSSFIKKTGISFSDGQPMDELNKNTIVYGIDCERCHGPAEKHIDFHENNPSVQQPRFISKMEALPREAKLDMCAICHSGAANSLQSSFYYEPGQSRSAYFKDDTAVLNTGEVDVHGKQYQLLKASKCFLKSNTLTCTSCHNPHVTERNNLAGFSAKCLTCHGDVDHKTPAITNLLSERKTDCINCHMPEKPSALITMNTQGIGDPTPAMVRTHFISVDNAATKKYLKHFSQRQSSVAR